jgi:GR25 family glycosyltransferase involved in LPS biosynthesis
MGDRREEFFQSNPLRLQIVLINMTGSIERRPAVNSLTARHDLSFRFFDAIDGAQEPNPRLTAAYDKDAKRAMLKHRLSPGAFAARK